MWEEVKFNMWGEITGKKEAMRRAVQFTGNHRLYGRYMMRVVNEWRYSCENGLTDSSLNHKAFIGHCAAAMALRLPENIVREAWGRLSNEQRYKADMAAKRAIEWWWVHKGSDFKVHRDVGGSLLS